MSQPEEKAFTESPIGLCLSGGGYRAASFHLGTLSYLERVNLLGNVRALSTVSGGTFVGVMYTMALLRNIPFKDFFRQTCDRLLDTHLVELALAKLGTPSENASGRRNLIVSMAEVYGETFFKGPDGSPALLGEILDSDADLPDLTFNSTEFRTGVAFRFQRRKGAMIGNGNVNIPVKDAAKMRLADIVAASSCFPGGFEPLAFPDDFTWPEKNPPKRITERLSEGGLPPRVALMDGGIWDNQGAQSLDLAVEKEAEELSMFIISDVSAKEKDLYPFPERLDIGNLTGSITLGLLNRIVWAFFIACGISSIALGWQLAALILNGGFSFFYDFFLYCVPLFLAGSTFGALYRLRKLIIKEVFPAIPQAKLAAWDDLKQVTLSQLSEMLQLRISSLYSMASAIFMKRIRSLVMDAVCSNPTYKEKWVANFIYDLKTGKAPGKTLDPPSDELRKLSETAESMPTTLWFDNAEALYDLVACGQVTTCYNIIRLINRT